MLIIVFVFFAVFLVVSLVLFAFRGSDAEKKQTAARLGSLVAGQVAPVVDVRDLRKQEAMSSIPLLHALLIRLDVTSKVHKLLSQADLGWTPSRLFLLCAAAALIPGYLVYLRTDAAIVSLIVGVTLGCAPVLYVRYLRQRRFNQVEEALPGALDLMVSGLRSGHSLISAINLVGREMADPIGREFRTCFDEQNYGLEFRTAMENLVDRIPIQDVRIIVTAVLIQKETGGNLAEVLDKCGHVIRDRFRLKKEIRVRTAQGRLTGGILTLLPLILGFLMYLVNPKHISLLWQHPTGLKMLYTASAMTVVGGLIIRKIVRIRV